MRIAVDCRYVRTGRHDGISRFTAGVVGALAERTRGDDEVDLTMIVSDLRQLDKLPDLPHLLVSDPTSPREPLVALQVAAARPDVVWSPMQTMGSWGRRHRLVLTLHDLIYYTNRTPRPSSPCRCACSGGSTTSPGGRSGCSSTGPTRSSPSAGRPATR